MKKAHKKRPPRATANSPPGLADMGKLLYKSGKFIKIYFTLLTELALFKCDSA